MTDLTVLEQQITDRTAHVAVIGLGYVGLPVACLLASAGFRVTGVDINQARIDKINAGISPIEGIEPGLAELVAQVTQTSNLTATTRYDEIATARVVLITVDTPVEADTHQPLYKTLLGALRSLGSVLGAGTLVIIESTVAPGTISKLVIPTLVEISGLTAGTDFWVGHCPERVMPGRLLNNLRKMDRVVGGMSDEVCQAMMRLYQTYVEGALDPAAIITAELVKTGENAYRDINIAFANEMARICEAVGGDVWAVRELLNKSPGRNMLLPGAGVGGHCIPKDPWLLAYGAGDAYHARLIASARAINEEMPAHILQLTADALAEAGLPLAGSKLAVLGYAYLENSDDTRHSPTAALIEQLQLLDVEIAIHDPFVKPYNSALENVLNGADCVIVMVAHAIYCDLDLGQMAGQLRHVILVDGRHVFAPEALSNAGFIYRIIGRAR